MKYLKMSILISMVYFLSSCSTLAQKSNALTDDKIKSETSGVIGCAPDDLTILSRRTEGENTFVNLLTKDGKKYTCTINGGNALTLWTVNPPMCSATGEPTNLNPFTNAK